MINPDPQKYTRIEAHGFEAIKEDVFYFEEKIICKTYTLKVLARRDHKISLQNIILEDGAQLIIIDSMAAKEILIENLYCLKNASVRFVGCNLQNLHFRNSDFDKFIFQDVVWPKDGVMTRMEHEEKRADQTDDDVTFERMQKYRQLIISAEQRRDFPAAEQFYRREQTLATILARKTDPCINYLLLKCYSIFSGYGTSLSRAGFWLFFAFVAPLFALCTLGEFSRIEILPDVQISAAPIQFSEVLSFYLSTLTFQKDRLIQAVDAFTAITASVGLVAFTAQLALFLFALRRALRRASV